MSVFLTGANNLVFLIAIDDDLQEMRGRWALYGSDDDDDDDDDSENDNDEFQGLLDIASMNTTGELQRVEDACVQTQISVAFHVLFIIIIYYLYTCFEMKTSAFVCFAYIVGHSDIYTVFICFFSYTCMPCTVLYSSHVYWCVISRPFEIGFLLH